MSGQTTERPRGSRHSSGLVSERPEGRAGASLALSWSGGKDSALTLWTLCRQGMAPEALITTVSEGYDRISMHGVRRELLARQAEALGVRLSRWRSHQRVSKRSTRRGWRRRSPRQPLGGVAVVAFGDLFLEDVRAYREERLAVSAKAGLFPMWGRRDTAELAREFVAAGFEAIVVCLDPAALEPCFAGVPYDGRLLDELPASVDGR